jgi:D-alanyl-D-alanine carboxypeptidase
MNKVLILALFSASLASPVHFSFASAHTQAPSIDCSTAAGKRDSSAGPAATPRPVNLPSLPVSYPVEQGAGSPQGHAALDRAAASFAERAPAWSLAVTGSRMAPWHRTLGADPGARFAAASIGKSMTAVLVFQQIDAGKLSLSDTADTWYPDLPNAGLVTIEHLLTHRSGYVVPAGGPLTGGYRPPETEFERLREHGAAFCPGEGWAYSNVAYQLLGRILERVSGQSYAALLKSRILEPLELRNTWVLEASTHDPALVPGHSAGQAVEPVNYATPFAAAPVTTDAQDLVRYWRALIEGRLVSAASLARMIDPAWPMFGNPQMRYGSGVQVAEIPDGPGTLVLHSGGIVGFSATVAWVPERELFVAVLSNDRQVPAEAALWALIQSLDQ